MPMSMESITLTLLPVTAVHLVYLEKFYELSEEELDYSIIGSFAPPEANGKCVYCNHCKPCPVGLDIGMINKFYDLAKIGDDMARAHYHALDTKAGDCIRCGHCNSRCMFGVDQMSRMQEIKEYFGE
ncbi:MAG: 4Fe-4S dicluster domain-containing protein [Lachnospiraceae bacterium]|nr:4Fe-4S dicluster domain-containing protein [Lachnospiraceae bacterium]